MRTKGFTLLESMIVLSVLSVFTLLSVNSCRSFKEVISVYEVMDDIALTQYRAIKQSESLIYEYKPDDLQSSY